MSSAVRVLRFARVPDTLPAAPRGQVLVANVLLDEQPVGQIVQQFHAWHYQLIDGSPSGLVSTLSRQDIEAQIALHYFGPENGLEKSPHRLPLAM
jgi:hypothetical protein